MLGLNNLLVTPAGLLTLSEVFADSGVTANCGNKTVPVDYRSINRYGTAEKTCSFSKNGRRPTFAFTTVSGNQINCTAGHRLLMMSPFGNWVWKKADELQLGDHLVARREFPVSIGQRAVMSDEHLYLLGTFLADGHFGTRRMQVTNNDPVVIDHIMKHGPTLLDVDLHRYATKSAGSYDFHFNSISGVKALYDRLGWEPCVAKDKHLGPVLRRLSTEQIRLVLQGYFDCE
jgi:hypothetical protein